MNNLELKTSSENKWKWNMQEEPFINIHWYNDLTRPQYNLTDMLQKLKTKETPIAYLLTKIFSPTIQLYYLPVPTKFSIAIYEWKNQSYIILKLFILPSLLGRKKPVLPNKLIPAGLVRNDPALRTVDSPAS